MGICFNIQVLKCLFIPGILGGQLCQEYKLSPHSGQCYFSRFVWFSYFFNYERQLITIQVQMQIQIDCTGISTLYYFRPMAHPREIRLLTDGCAYMAEGQKVVW